MAELDAHPLQAIDSDGFFLAEEVSLTVKPDFRGDRRMGLRAFGSVKTRLAKGKTPKPPPYTRSP